MYVKCAASADRNSPIKEGRTDGRTDDAGCCPFYPSIPSFTQPAFTRSVYLAVVRLNWKIMIGRADLSSCVLYASMDLICPSTRLLVRSSIVATSVRPSTASFRSRPEKHVIEIRIQIVQSMFFFQKHFFVYVPALKKINTAFLVT